MVAQSSTQAAGQEAHKHVSTLLLHRSSCSLHLHPPSISMSAARLVEGEQVVQAQGGDRDALASQVSQGRKVPTTERQGTPSRVQFVRHFTP